MTYEVTANTVSTALLHRISRLYTCSSLVGHRIMTTTSSRFKDKLKHAASVSEIRKTGLEHSLVMPLNSYPGKQKQQAVKAFMALLILAKIAKSKSSTCVKFPSVHRACQAETVQCMVSQLYIEYVFVPERDFPT